MRGHQCKDDNDNMKMGIFLSQCCGAENISFCYVCFVLLSVSWSRQSKLHLRIIFNIP